MAALTTRNIYRYRYYHNDIPVLSLEFNVEVNKLSGKVEFFKGLDYGERIPQEYADGVPISAEKAKTAYLEHIGLNLKYNSYNDYEQVAICTFPAYSLVDTWPYVAIDAQSGEPANLWFPSFGYGENYGYFSDTMHGGVSLESESDLTVRGQEAVDTAAGIISKDQALAVVRKAIGDSSLTIKSADCQSNSEEGKYVWRLFFNNGSGSVDAKTGEILSYDNYSENTGERDLTYGEALIIAEEFIKTQSLDKAGQTKLNESSKLEKVAYGYDGIYTFTFDR